MLKQTQNSRSYLYAYTVYYSAGYAHICCCRCNHTHEGQRINNIRNSCFSRLYTKQVLNTSIHWRKFAHINTHSITFVRINHVMRHWKNLNTKI